MDLIADFAKQLVEQRIQIDQGRKVKGSISTDTLPKFRHIDARSIEDAVSWLKTYGSSAAVIAGGTDLLRELKRRSRPTQPTVLVNLKTIKPRLDSIEECASSLRVGSLATLYCLETSELLNRKYNILVQAAHTTRALQYRTMATLGGELCQQVRCWYHRAGGNAYFCSRKGGASCYALEGDNRYHGIFGSGVCVAACPSDTAPALVALRARVKTASVSGERLIPVEEFFTTVGNVLSVDEIVTEVQVPIPEADSRSCFIKFGVGNKFGRTLVSVAMVARMDGRLWREARIVLGAVSPVPWRAVHAEQLLQGMEVTGGTAETVARIVAKDASPLAMNAYKVGMVEAIVKQAILEISKPA